ncbi:AAA family ATPase [bacterium]|nr:AAA family ATPase [bacterium]
MNSFVISNTLYNAVKTDNPILDGIIGCIISSLIYQIISYYPVFIEAVKKYFTKNKPEIHEMVISQYIAHERQQPNRCYYAIYRFLNRHNSNITGTLRGEKSMDHNRIYFTLNNSETAELTFENATIWIEFVETEKNLKEEVVITRIYRITTHTSNDVLKRMVAHAVKLYEDDHTIKVEWKPCKMTREKNAWFRYWISNTKTFNNLIMETSLKSTLQNDIDHFMKSKEWYARKGIPWTRGYLLYGTPGCGKTSVIKTISNAHELPIYIMNLSTIYTDKALEEAFAGLESKCMVVLEDIDCMTDISHRRKDAEGEPTVKTDDKDCVQINRLTLGALLNELDGVSNASGRIVVMTTNHVEKLDPALIRPGRIDFRIELKKCSIEMIQSIHMLIFDTELDQKYLPRLKEGVLTPAEVMNTFMSLPKETAIERLIEMLDSKIQADGAN